MAVPEQIRGKDNHVQDNRQCIGGGRNFAAQNFAGVAAFIAIDNVREIQLLVWNSSQRRKEEKNDIKKKKHSSIRVTG